MNYPTGTDEVSIPAETTRNVPRMTGVMRRKVGTKSFPWAVAVINHTPPPPQDEDIPARKKPRLETSTSIAVDVGIGVGVAAHTPDTLATVSPSDIVDVAPAPRDAVTASPTLQSTNARRAPRVRRKWKPEEDAKLIDAIKKHGNKWLTIATLVPGRNNKECRQRWAVNLDPNNNRKMGTWTAEEDRKLIDAIEKHGGNWVTVSALVPGRTKVQCRERWTLHFVPTQKGKWSAAEDAKLHDAIRKCDEDWVAVAALVSGRTNIQCYSRWATIDRTTRRAGKWTTEEDAKLTGAFKKHGKDWLAVAAMVPGRTNTLCRQRWATNLDPNIINRTCGKWAAKEDAKLIEGVQKHGNNNWLAVTAIVPGRTKSQCRQRWANFVDPSIDRTLGKWATEEDAKLIDAVKKCGKDWLAVAALVPGRNNEQCCHRWVAVRLATIEGKSSTTGKWTREEDAKLIEAVAKCGKDWVAVAALVPGRTRLQCRHKFSYEKASKV